MLVVSGCKSVNNSMPQTSSGLEQVKVEGGLISGVPAEKPGVTAFKGIPYTAPPVGDLRWKAPQPVPAWDGVKKCDTFANILTQSTKAWGVYQKEFFSDPYPKMSEDCLCLNVFTPAKAANERLPVMVWIHGGGFVRGWSYEMEYNSDNLARKGVILVTIEYRTSIFGFMAHPELTGESPNKSSGNYGLLDQIAALKWVKNNIKGFGGDPENVTVFGQSAGAMSIAVMNCSPLAKGLYNKAIMQSGGGIDESAYNLNMPLSDAEKIGSEIQTTLNCNSIADMRKLSADELYTGIAQFQPKSVKSAGYFYLVPNVDGYLQPDTVKNMVSKGNLSDIAYIIGSNANDIPGATDMALAFAINRAEEGKRNAYLYEFTRAMPGDDSGAFHCAELWYVFQTLDKCWRPLTEADTQLADQMASYWANFATTGNPNGDGLVKWNNFKKDSKFKMVFDVHE